MSDHTRNLSNLFDTKAMLWNVELLAKPVAEEDLEARAQAAEREVEAMQEAEVALGYLNRAVTATHGSEKFVAATTIAYAPHDLDGLALVAEYYRRAERIECL
jgi:hypothetical protein